MVHEKKQKELIQRLRALGIQNKAVLEAIYAVPRHIFVPSAFAFQAYDEKALPIGFGQTISHPFTVARMTEALEIKPNHRILEIGTGSGYQTAILCQLGAQVFSVELMKELAQIAEKRLKQLNLPCAIRHGNGAHGWQEYAPYDRIIVTAGAVLVPEKLLNQLKPHGRMIIPVGSKEEQRLELYTLTRQGINKEDLGSFKFVPLLDHLESKNANKRL